MASPVQILIEILTSEDRGARMQALTDEEASNVAAFVLDCIHRQSPFSARDRLAIYLPVMEASLYSYELIQKYHNMPTIMESRLEGEVTRHIQEKLNVRSRQCGELSVHIARKIRLAAHNTREIPKPEYARFANRLSESGELRCEYCGYHFRWQDLSAKLRQHLTMASDEPAALVSHAISPVRLTDEYKPATSVFDDKTILWTEAHVDHRNPIAWFGEGSADNLILACRWCNLGKSSSRSWPELISYVHMNVFSRPFDMWAIPFLQASSFVVICRDRKCVSCNRGPTVVELAAKPLTDGTIQPRIPGDCAAKCYHCIAEGV